MSFFPQRTVRGVGKALGLHKDEATTAATPCLPKGFTPITQFDERDVFIAGYPKSGNTWMQDLLSAAVYGISPRYCPATLVQELVPDVHYKEVYQRYRTPMFFKTHHLPRPEYKRVIHLLRDGRDVMVSYFHYTAALRDTPPDFLKMVRGGLFPCRWHEHVEAWLANPYGAAILTVKYEEMKKDPARELRRVCEFAEVERDAAFLDEVARETDFAKMQKKEAREPAHFDSNWSKDKLFRRRGEVGSHRDEMPPEVLREFLAISGDALRRCGYE
jgi:hypothetical protein